MLYVCLYSFSKKQKSKQREIIPARKKPKKRNIGETEEAEQEVPSKRGKLNGRKRNIVEVEEAAQADSSKRQKSELLDKMVVNS